MESFKDKVKYCLLKSLVVLIYVVSHLYDYAFYPIYFLVYHPWLVRRYKKAIHARCEVKDDCVVYHSLEQPTVYNQEIEDNGLVTLDKIFQYVSQKYGSKDCLGTRDILSEEDEYQPNGKIFKKYVMGDYKWRSFEDFGDESARVARGLLSLGLKGGDLVAIMAETRAEWLISAAACFRNNLSLVTLYANLGTDGVAHALQECEASTLICSHETFPKVKAVVSKGTAINLNCFVVMKSPVGAGSKRQQYEDQLPSKIKVMMYEDLLEEKQGSEVQQVPEPPTPDDKAIIMYTSGSTGSPKGVILTHRNLVAAMSALINIAKFRPKDRYIGYLPLAHVLELLAESCCLLRGIKIGYSSSLTLTNKSSKVKAGCKGDANLLRPTLMCAVPLILERIYKSIVDTMKRQGWAAEELFHYFMSYKMKWQDRGFDTPLLNKTLFRKIRYFMGGRVRLMLSGGAPLSPDTHSLTRTCLCVPLMQGYGLTETTALATTTSPRDRTTGRAGAPQLNVKIKLVSWEEGNYRFSDSPNPRGEIHVGGANVAMGYFKNEEKTREDFYEDEDGTRWFRTGDIGEFDLDGVLRIIDRKKDLVKLQGGEYVSFGKVEAVLKTCPVVENICLHADSSKDYVFAVVVPNPASLRETLGETTTTPEKLNLEDPAVKAKVVEIMAAYGLKNGLEKFEMPRKVLLVLDEWTPDSGLVTAAFKIRRRFIVERYNDRIKAAYT